MQKLWTLEFGSAKARNRSVGNATNIDRSENAANGSVGNVTNGSVINVGNGSVGNATNMGMSEMLL